MSEEVLETSCTINDLLEEESRDVKIRYALFADRRLLVSR